jgi:histidine triad (HIT) family protein
VSCPFCAIVAGQAGAAVVARARGVIAFLDARPLFLGHVLVMPEAHVETLVDLPREAVEPLFSTVQQVARALERGLGAAGSFTAVNTRVSQSVPHLHVHVVPREKGDGLRGFFWPRRSYHSDEERERLRAAIASAIARAE